MTTEEDTNGQLPTVEEDNFGIGEGDIEEIEDDEYNVEDIRSERRNKQTGVMEYFVKWQDYPESQNTWEPIQNLKCPEIIARFRERQKAERLLKRRSNGSVRLDQTSSKKTRRFTTDQPANTHESLLVEDEDETASTTETISSSCSNNRPELIAEVKLQPKGFERNLPLELILGSCTDDKEKLWFFVKWKGLDEVECIDAAELEEKAPKEMCCWYRERLIYSLNSPNEGFSMEPVKVR